MHPVISSTSTSALKKFSPYAASIIDNTRRFNPYPKRFSREALPETQKIITEDQIKQLLNDYYRAPGWNEKGEAPKSERHQRA